jgi:Rps23 Pro-64 3,4-dihydroxylase Tpa1-like proline 4-hydroxylase
MLRQTLSDNMPWSLAYKDTAGVSRKIWAEELAQMNSEQINRCAQQAIERARHGEFSFLYHTYMMISAYQQRRNPELIALHKLTEALNQAPWLNVMRELANDPAILKTSAQATRYTAGQFLTTHNDSAEGELRYLAYVIQLTRDWRSDWGGLLQFMDDKRHITDTVTPQYNSIALFKTPRLHCVSPVANYAAGERLTITGWLRGDDKAAME